MFMRGMQKMDLNSAEEIAETLDQRILSDT